MAKKFNLAELIPEEMGPVSKSDTKRIEMIPITDIRANPKNFYSMNEMQSLEDSIELNGLMEPLCVFKRDDGYMLFSGHRRFKALRFLHEKSRFTKWAEVPCIVYPDPHDDDRETVMLIHANSTGRVLTAYETSQQAQRLKTALTNMKKKGADLPGRIRDMVAAEMDVSAAKLARLSAIENKLEDCWQESWRQGLLGESVAYEVIRLDSPGQQNLFDWWTTVCGRRITDLKMSDVKGFRERMLGSKPKDAARETECLSCRDCADYLPKNGICARSGHPTAPYDGCSMAHRKEGTALISNRAKSNEKPETPTCAGAAPAGMVTCAECVHYSAYDGACDNSDSMYCGVKPGEYCSRGEARTGAKNEPKDVAPPAAWHRIHAVEPPEGALVAIFSGNGWLDMAIYRGGQFWFWDDQNLSIEVKSSQFWTELPKLSEEAER